MRNKIVVTLLISLVFAALLNNSAVMANMSLPHYNISLMKERVADIKVFVKCIEAEATDGTYEQKLNVASCIINRSNQRGFPHRIYDVIYDKNQFAVVSDGRINKVKLTTDSLKAALTAIVCGPVHNCNFFCTPKASKTSSFFRNKKISFYDGMHNHYYMK